MSLKLLTFPALFRSQKILITAEYAGVPVEVDTNVKGEEMAGMTPQGKVPVLVTPEGNLSESNAIAKFVARKGAATSTVYGRTPFESAQVDAWLDFCANELDVPATLWISPILGWLKYNEAVMNKAVEDLKRALHQLEAHLATETYLVGRQITMADIAVVTTLLLPMKIVMDEPFRKPFPNVMRWFNTCVNQQQFVDVIGTVALCEKPLKPAESVAAPGADASKAAKPAAAPKEAKEAKPKEKAAPAQAAAKPAPKRTQEDRAAEEDEPVVHEEKAKNPLDDLPKSSFVLDAWKREYSNNKDSYSAMKYFWENYDAGGWSLWFCKYKYDEENTVVFRTSNLVGGFCQKSEELRRYAMMVLQICGTDKAQKIRGGVLIRGQDIKPLLEANEMAESYEWVRCDPAKSEDKAKFEELWCDENGITIDGVKAPILDCKVFK